MPAFEILARLKLAGDDFSRKFKAEMDGAEKEARASANRVTSALASLRSAAAGAAAGLTIAGIAEVANQALEFADNLDAASKKAGLSVERYQTLKESLRTLEITGDQTDAAFTRLQITLGDVQSGVSNSATKAVERPGVTAQITGGQIDDTGEFLDALAAAAKRGGTAMQYGADMSDILGRSVGVEMAAALRDGGAELHQLEQGVRDSGLVIKQDMIERMADANEAIDRWLTKLQQGAALGVGSALTWLDRFSYKLAGVQQQLNDWDPDWFASAQGDIDAFEKGNSLDLIQRQRWAVTGAVGEVQKATNNFGSGDLVTQQKIRELRDATTELERLTKLQEGLNAKRRPAPALRAIIDDRDAPAASAVVRRVKKDAEDAILQVENLRDLLGKIDVGAKPEYQDTFDRLIGGDQKRDLDDVMREVEERRGAEAKLREDANREQIEFQEELAQRQYDQVRDLANFYRDAMSGGVGSIWDAFEQQGKDAIAYLAAQFTLAMISGQKFDIGSSLTQMTGAGGIGGIWSLFGGSGGLGGILGGAGGAAQAAGNLPGAAAAAGGLGGLGAVGGALSAAAPYLALAAFALPLVSGVLGGTKRGSAIIGGSGSDPSVTGFYGNSSSRKQQSEGLAGNAIEGFNAILEQLGASYSGTIRTSVGVREGNLRLDPQGRGYTKLSKGAIDFGSDERALMEAAIRDMLSDVTLNGISAAAQKLLRSPTGDLEKAVEKALLIESIPKLLDARLDPAGAALDQLNDKWKPVIAALKEGGASAQQMAEAQKLYNLELEDTKANARDAAASLREFLDGFKAGADSPFSLRDQERNAEAALQPYLDKIAGGTTIDQDKYLAAAQTFLDVERELYGSTSSYFEALDRIQAATGKAISAIDNAKPIRTAADPFAEATSKHTLATAEILSQHTQQLAAQNQLLGLILGAVSGGGAREPRLYGQRV